MNGITKLAFLVCAVVLSLSQPMATAEAQDSQTASTLNPKVFQILDNMEERPVKSGPQPTVHKPDTAALGMVHCNIVYLDQRTKKKGYDAIPDEPAFKAMVRKEYAVPGPLVLDMESLDLKGDAATKNIKIFINLVQWSHEAAPGSVVGYYGHGLFPNPPDKQHAMQAKKLADAVDAFFPSMYTFDDDRVKWKSKLETLIEGAHRIAPGKPVYPYIWPQYHEGTPKALQFVSGDYWTYQLRTLRASGVNGIVIWFPTRKDWPIHEPWWQTTVKFAGELKK